MKLLLFAVAAVLFGCQDSSSNLKMERAPSELRASRILESNNFESQHVFVNEIAYCLLSPDSSTGRVFSCHNLKDNVPLETPVPTEIWAVDRDLIPNRIFSSQNGDICAMFNSTQNSDSDNLVLCWRYFHEKTPWSDRIKFESSFKGTFDADAIFSSISFDCVKCFVSVDGTGRISIGSLTYDLVMPGARDLSVTMVSQDGGQEDLLLYGLDYSGLNAWRINGEGGIYHFTKHKLPPQVENPMRIVANRWKGERACLLGEKDLKCWFFHWFEASPFREFALPQLVKPKEIVSYRDGFCAIDSTGVICWYDFTVSSYTVIKMPIGEALLPKNQALVSPKNLIAESQQFCVNDESQIKCWNKLSMKSSTQKY